jgi:hypothetical protein
MSEDLEEILDQRSNTHGNFTNNAMCSQRLKEDLRAWGPNWERMRPYQREALDNICQKLSRIATGDLDEIDHWLDIAGYATLVVDRLKGVK